MGQMPISLDSRQAAILLVLLKSKQPVTANELADKLELTTRKLRYSLPRVGLWLKEHGCSLSVRPHIGIVVEANRETRRSLLNEFQTMTPFVLLTPADRLHLLLFQLLCTDDYLNGQKQEKALMVSRATLSKTRQLAEMWLNDRGLHLERRPKLGIRAAGSEVDFRHALVSLLMQVLPHNDLHNLIWQRTKKPHQVTRPSAFYQHVSDEISTWPLETARNYTDVIEKRLSIRLPEVDRLPLMLYLGVTIQRLDQNHIVEIPEARENAASALLEFTIINDIALSLQQERGTHLTRSECAQFALEVRSVSSHPSGKLIED